MSNILYVYCSIYFLYTIYTNMSCQWKETFSVVAIMISRLTWIWKHNPSSTLELMHLVIVRYWNLSNIHDIHEYYTKNDLPSFPNAKGLRDHMLILLHLPDTMRLYFWPRNVIFSACKITQKVGYCKSLESYARIIWYACASATFITNSNVFPTKFDWYERP